MQFRTESPLRFRQYRHTSSSTPPSTQDCYIFSNCITRLKCKLGLQHTHTHRASERSLGSLAPYPTMPTTQCLVSAGHARHPELQANDGRLLLGQLLVGVAAVELPLQLSVALLAALGAAAALYGPLRVAALRGLFAHLVLRAVAAVLVVVPPPRVFAADGRPQNEGVGARRERVGVGPLVSGGGRRVGRHHGGHAQLVESLGGGGKRGGKNTFAIQVGRENTLSNEKKLKRRNPLSTHIIGTPSALIYLLVHILALLVH